MASPRLELSIVLPERNVFAGAVDEVTLPGSAGGMGILPGHEALLTTLAAGRLSYRVGDQRTELKLLGGFAEVTPSGVQVLADGVEEAEPVDGPGATARGGRGVSASSGG